MFYVHRPSSELAQQLLRFVQKAQRFLSSHSGYYNQRVLDKNLFFGRSYHDGSALGRFLGIGTGPIALIFRCIEFV